jgi:hypothetical protein
MRSDEVKGYFWRGIENYTFLHNSCDYVFLFLFFVNLNLNRHPEPTTQHSRRKLKKTNEPPTMSSLDQKIEELKAKVTTLKTAHPKWRDEPVAEVDECIAQLKAAIKEKGDAEKAAKKAATPAPAKSSSLASASTSADDEKALLALQAKKDTDFSAWYLELIYKAELISAYSVSGCYM